MGRPPRLRRGTQSLVADLRERRERLSFDVGRNGPPPVLTCVISVLLVGGAIQGDNASELEFVALPK